MVQFPNSERNYPPPKMVMFFVNFLIFSSLTAGILAISAKVDLSQVSDGYRGQIHVENGDSVQLNLKKSSKFLVKIIILCTQS